MYSTHISTTVTHVEGIAIVQYFKGAEVSIHFRLGTARVLLTLLPLQLVLLCEAVERKQNFTTPCLGFYYMSNLDEWSVWGARHSLGMFVPHHIMRAIVPSPPPPLPASEADAA